MGTGGTGKGAGGLSLHLGLVAWCGVVWWPLALGLGPVGPLRASNGGGWWAVAWGWTSLGGRRLPAMGTGAGFSTRDSRSLHHLQPSGSSLSLLASLELSPAAVGFLGHYFNRYSQNVGSRQQASQGSETQTPRVDIIVHRDPNDINIYTYILHRGVTLLQCRARTSQ